MSRPNPGAAGGFLFVGPEGVRAADEIRQALAPPPCPSCASRNVTGPFEHQFACSDCGTRWLPVMFLTDEEVYRYPPRDPMTVQPGEPFVFLGPEKTETR